MLKILANVFSYLFHPLIVPLYGLGLLAMDPYFLPYTPYIKYRFLLQAMVLLVVLPVGWFFFLRKIGIVRTPQASERRERTWAYLFTAVAYLVTCWLALRMNLQVTYSVLLLGGALGVGTITWVNSFWKMSAHALGMGAFVSGLLYVSIMEGRNPIQLYCTFILLSGIVGSSRLVLEEHTLGQVVVGYLVGLASPWVALLLTLLFI